MGDEMERLRANAANMAAVLEWLDRRGGLGYGAHGRITTALADYRALIAAAPRAAGTGEVERAATVVEAEITLHAGQESAFGKLIASFIWPEDQLGPLRIPTKWIISSLAPSASTEREKE